MKKLFILLLTLAWPLAAPGQEVELPSADDAEAAITADELENEEDLFLFDEEDEFIVSDPLEPLNRGIFWFNDKLYFYLLKPIARGWRWAAPEPVRISVQNFFSNLATPVRFINAGLQGKFGDAGNEFTRFLTNTTVGVLGLFDVSKEHFGLSKKDEDTGQTLGHYGLGPGFYLVLPVFGPSNLRDGVGLLVDSRLDLLYYISEGRTYWGLIAFDKINYFSIDKDTYEGIKKDALDPYLFVRDAYIQYRQNKVEN